MRLVRRVEWGWPGVVRGRPCAPVSHRRGASVRVYGIFKTTVEWVAALVLLVLVLPILGVLAVVLVLNSPGPVLYSQIRLGQGGRPFRIYKLRTMTSRCEAATGPVWSIAGDPRVTKVGRWLRATHLDELPQLWNILRGEMALIGPRPERPEIAAKIEVVLPAFRDRLLVRPGITGLAQMLLPPDSDLHTVRRKLACDLQYVDRMGPELDARIAVSTALSLGGLALAASRVFVEPFAPSQSIELPASVPAFQLSLADHGIGRAPAASDQLSRAA